MGVPESTMASGGSPTVSIVIPAYNEAARLLRLQEALACAAEPELARAGLSYLEAIIVDDGSEDQTGTIVEGIAAADPRVRGANVGPVNLGKGAAVAAGIREAKGEFVLIVDVDLSTPLSCIAVLASAMRESRTRMVIGSRDIAGSRVEAPIHRRLLGEAFNFAVKRLTGLPHADTQCGFKLIESSLARELARDQISAGYAFDVEMLVRARSLGVDVVEVPVTYVHDDRSRVRIARASFEMATDLIRIKRSLRPRRRATREL